MDPWTESKKGRLVHFCQSSCSNLHKSERGSWLRSFTIFPLFRGLRMLTGNLSTDRHGQ